MNPTAQIIVLDAGGQYCHLIARKVRDLGVYAEVRASETPASELASAKGLIISGGPSSVYDPASPTVDPAIFSLGVPVLGICYGQQLMAHLLGGEVRKGDKGEYGLATLDLADASDALFGGLGGTQQIWMSHRDVVGRVPEGFSDRRAHRHLRGGGHGSARARVLRACSSTPRWSTPRAARSTLPTSCSTSAGAARIGTRGTACRCSKQEIRECVGDRNVFFFVSGGVDSSVAFALCTRALGADRVRGVYVDTGLMREGETDFVRRMPATSRWSTREEQFLSALAGRHRSGAEAPHHRRGVRAGAGAHHRIAPAVGRELDSGTGHDLPGHHRIAAARRRRR